MEQLRQLVVALVEREEVGCARGSGGGVDDNVEESDEKDARESSPQPGRRLRGSKVTGRNETGQKETGRNEMRRKTMRTKETGRNETGSKETGTKETGAKETVGKDTGWKATGAKAPGAQYSQGTGGKGGMLMCEREMDNMLPVDTTA